MLSRRFFAVIFLFAVLAAATLPAQAAEPHAGMLRLPDVSSTHIVFRYANDLWLVPREGGTAAPLASPPGGELFPKFSADGKTIAFVGNYDGNNDIYTIPLSGGKPFRVTHHPAFEILTDWTPEGSLLFYALGRQFYPRAAELFTVSAGGGLPEKMPVPYGAVASVSPEGKWLAYTPHTRDIRTWKRYRGGMATDIWLYQLNENISKKITDWEGTDTLPMWNGEKIYYLSDAGPKHKLNIWTYDTADGSRHQVTSHTDYDVKWPSIGPGDRGQGEIVYQYGSQLQLLDLETEKSTPVRVSIPGDRPKLRTHAVDVSENIAGGALSSTGKRVVVEARGDIWTLPAKKGSPLNLSRSSGVAERGPSWSPDGRWIAYFSDAGGSYDLYLIQSDGREPAKRLTSLEAGFLYTPTWSPDSNKISFWDQTGTLRMIDVESEKLTTVDSYPGQGPTSVSWSSDSNWITYARPERVRGNSCIWLYSVSEARGHRVTAGMFNDTWPVFDREGKYLYFASERDYSAPVYDDFGATWVYTETDRLYLVPLSIETESPLAAESDDETWDEEAGTGEKDDKDSENGTEDGNDEDTDTEEEPEPVIIDLTGFERRAIPVPVDKGGFYQLEVNDEGKLVYLKGAARGGDGLPSIHLLDLDDEEEKEKLILADVVYFKISGDGKKLVAATREGTMAIVDTRPDQKMDSVVPTSGMTSHIEPREEWRQIFTEAWRVQRDFFYDPNMHGLDWEALRKQYEPLLEDCATRNDVSYVIGEMIAELNVGHAYYFGGDVEEASTVSVGLLGCDFSLTNGAYRISRIIEGAPWDTDARGPLSQPGVDAEEGDYLLAVNGVPLNTEKDPWASFQDLAGKTVRLTVSADPSLGENDRQVVVELLPSEAALRYRSWIEHNRAYVAEKTDGRVGYIYVPNTGIDGQNDLVRQFHGQITRDALIIDERWNGGGQIPTRFIELLNRPVTNFWARRHAQEDRPWPPVAHHGPKCMLINGLAGSGGDHFPFLFRLKGLGKLIGTRTWGGLVGISGNPALIDGGYTSAPTFAFYETDGTWGIEGHGVEPDIEVVDDPALMNQGQDPQLDAAIRQMLKELEETPFTTPDRPPYPDRSGMGIPLEER